MQEGWLIRDGQVLASSVHPSGWHARVVSARLLTDGVGAVVVTGPAVLVGVAVARLGTSNRLRSVESPKPLHVVGFGHQAVAVPSEVAAALHIGDDLQFRVAP